MADYARKGENSLFEKQVKCYLQLLTFDYKILTLWDKIKSNSRDDSSLAQIYYFSVRNLNFALVTALPIARCCTMAHRLLSVSEPSKCMACGLFYHSMLLPNFGLMVNKWLCRLWKKSALLDSWPGLAVSLVSFCFGSRRYECIAFASRVYRPFTFDCRYCDGWFFWEKPKRCLLVYHEMYLEVNVMGGMYSHNRWRGPCISTREEKTGDSGLSCTSRIFALYFFFV